MLEWKSKHGNIMSTANINLLKQVFKVFNNMTVAIDDSQDLCKV